MTRKTQPRQLTTWQRRAVNELRSIAESHPESLELVTRRPTMSDDGAAVVVRLPTGELPSTPYGLTFRDHEAFTVTTGPYPLIPPQVSVDHDRFAGFPHVLLGRRLCIYLDPSREWRPEFSMTGFLERLWQWLTDAAAGSFDPQEALYHPVGGVLHRTEGTPTVVVRGTVSVDRPIQPVWLAQRTPHRLDLRITPHQGAHAALIVTLSSPLPFGAGLTLTGFLEQISALRAESRHPGASQRGWLKPEAVLTALAAATTRNSTGDPQYFILAVPNPAGSPPHLLAGRLQPVAADALRLLIRRQGANLNLRPADLRDDIPIEWCEMSDERADVTTRRDEGRPITSFAGADVHIWGCGGIGSWMAEFIARAGAAQITLCDPARVTGGLVVRQNYAELDVGMFKVEALAERLRKIRDDIFINVAASALPDEPAVMTTAHLIIDATVSNAIGGLLDSMAATLGRTAVIAQVATDANSGALGLLTVSAPDDLRGAHTIDANTSGSVLHDAALERYHRLWLEPAAGDELTPTLGCSVPTFHGSAADLAAVSAALTSLLGTQLTSPMSGTHLIALPHAGGAGPAHRFLAA